MTMNERRKKTAGAVQSALCILTAVLLCAAAVSIYREGAAARAAGDTLGWIYTRERIAMWAGRILPAAVLTVGWAVCSRMWSGKDGKLSSRTAKTALSGRKRQAAGGGESGTENDRRMRRLRMALFAAAAVLILAGIANGSMRDVLVKAVNLCTECIGLG